MEVDVEAKEEACKEDYGRRRGTGNKEREEKGVGGRRKQLAGGTEERRKKGNK